MRETNTRVPKLRLSKETLRRIEPGKASIWPFFPISMSCYPCPSTACPIDP